MTPDDVTYQEYPIHPSLAPFVKVIWSLESRRAIYNAPRERILPDGCVELVFHFHDPFRTYPAGLDGAIQPRSFVVGQMRRFLEIQPAGRMGLLAVRFHVRGAYLFFHGPLSDVTGEDVALEELWGERGRELTEQVALARQMRARVALVESALLGLMRDGERFDRTVDRCLEIIEQAEGNVNVAHLASEVGASRRQLTRQFQETVGMSPKEFGRVRRFLRAVRALSAGRHGTMADVAHTCGYFDQAHFNHDFRDMAGMTPREFFTFPHLAS